MFNVFCCLYVGVAYKVTVKTGAKKNGSTDAKVLYIIFIHFTIFITGHHFVVVK